MKPSYAPLAISVWCAMVLVCSVFGQDVPVRLDDLGKLQYPTDAFGNRLSDFSHCGYAGSNRVIPHVPGRIVLRPSGSDDTDRIQQAIDRVSRMELKEDGFRGAIVLAQGEFQISGQLRIVNDGIVLRGQGAFDGGTVLRATGLKRRTLVRFQPIEMVTDGVGLTKVVQGDVPAGQRKIELDSIADLNVGDRVLIRYQPNEAWVERVAGKQFGWQPGTHEVTWERTITGLAEGAVELDVPLTFGFDCTLGQVTVRRLATSERLHHVGIEDLRLESDYDADRISDEDHAWFGVTMRQVQDGWGCRLQFRHFAGGAIMLDEETSRISVVDCAAFAPVSEIGGYRRHTYFTRGQQTLFLRCWSEHGLHDFGVGHCAAGPNAFVNCYAEDALAESGSLESWATATLFDNVRIDGHDLRLANRWHAPPKAGWSAINSLIWQSQAAHVHCDRPPLGNNWAIGVWATPAGSGVITQVSDFVKPLSLFQHQMLERRGPDVANQIVGPFLLKPTGATNPTVQQAQVFVEESGQPAQRLIDVIRERWREARWSGSSEIVGIAEPVDLIEDPIRQAALEQHVFGIQNGWVTLDGKLLQGKHFVPQWWRGSLTSHAAREMGPAITRFVPGRVGTGLTDDLDDVATWMNDQGIVGYDHHYGLWYDRRRDDHLMVRRADGEVVPPFYEQPFRRSGQGIAWDGLSRYDLSEFNPWYWRRLSGFARLGNQHQFMMFHHHYFQHHILEAGAHWADSPWRPANNVNETGLPEPPPYVGDKRIFFDDNFYDVENERLATLHRNYIRECLKQTGSYGNVIQFVSAEYSGPLPFVQFWMDTIVQWEKETGQGVTIGLSCPKDVQDAILADPMRSAHIDVIDIRYWTYTNEQQLYAPAGGLHLSPRQHLRQLKPKVASFDSIARAVSEYRRKFPDKAITYYADLYCRSPRDGWAVLMGGGSLAEVPKLPDELSRALVRMKPSDFISLGEHQWCLANGDLEFLIYSAAESASELRLPAGRQFEWQAIDVRSGKPRGPFQSVHDAAVTIASGPVALWVRDEARCGDSVFP